jgi:hypothetical protein
MPSRALVRKVDRELERAAQAAALLPAPIVVRLSDDPDEVAIEDTAGLTITPSAFASEDADAALRAHLANPAPYGPTIRRVVLLGFQRAAMTIQELALVGRLSAIERTAPDRESARRWAEVGAPAPMGVGMPIVKQAEARPL